MRSFVLISAFSLAGFFSHLLVIGPTAAVAEEGRLVRPLGSGSAIQFASVQEGADHLKRNDRFLKAMSRFDRQSRLNSDEDVTSADVGRFAAQQVVAWTDGEVEKLSDVIKRIQQKLGGYDLPFPETVLLIKTTGREEGNAAYCRTNSIVLPERIAAGRPAGLERTMTHELFHVLSSHNPELRRRLYEVIGFKPCNPIALPQALQQRKLTNPDGPVVEDYIEIDFEGKKQAAVPILFSSAERFDPSRGKSFFSYLTFRLMLIESNDGQWNAQLRNGEPILLNPKSTPSYHARIGKNTGYIIHPDEIMADNFVHLIYQSDNLATPDIIDRMKEILTQPR